MSVTILITEEQKRRLLSEESGNKLGDVIKQNYEFVKKIVNDSSKQIGINLEFLITWGATIGGFVGPLEDFLAGQYPELSDLEISLILMGVISSYYIDNKTFVTKIYEKIKEEGLIQPFKTVLNKSKELKEVFLEFIGSLGVTLHKVTNIMSYTFIIPLIPMLYNLAKGDSNSVEPLHIAQRLSGFGLLTISGIILKELINKLIKRFQSKS
jgi:hypothetical protein